MLFHPLYTILGLFILPVLQETNCKKATLGSELELGSKTNFKGKNFALKLRKSGKSGLKYCGSQEIRPLKNLVCKDYCEEGECRDFYCECQSDITLKQSCVQADDTSRCANICKRANFSKSYHCAKRQSQHCVTRHCRAESSEYHCFCN